MSASLTHRLKRGSIAGGMAVAPISYAPRVGLRIGDRLSRQALATSDQTYTPCLHLIRRELFNEFWPLKQFREGVHE